MSLQMNPDDGLVLSASLSGVPVDFIGRMRVCYGDERRPKLLGSARFIGVQSRSTCCTNSLHTLVTCV